MLVTLVLLLTFLGLGYFFNFVTGTGAIVFFFAIAGIIVISHRLVYGLALLPFAFALSPEIPLAGIPVRVQDFIVPVIFFFWLLDHFERGKEFKPSRLYVPFLLLIFFITVATFHAFVVQPDFNRLKGFFHLLKNIEYGIIFFLVFNIVNDRDDIRLLAVCSIVAASIIAVYSMTFSPEPTPRTSPESPVAVTDTINQKQQTETSTGRVHGLPTETANIFGGFLIFHLLMSTGFFLEEKRFSHRFFYLAASLILFYPVMFTFSRSSYVGLIVGFLFLGIVKQPLFLFFLVGLPFIGPPIFPETVISRFYTIYQAMMDASLTPSWQARLEAWKQFAPVIIRHPFIGKGLFYVPLGFIDNEYVLRALETGLSGLVVFLWLIGGFFNRAYHLFRLGVEKLDSQLGLGFMAGLTALSFHALAATSFTTIRIAEPFYFFSGLVVSAYLLARGIERGHSARHIRAREAEEKIMAHAG